MERLTFEIHDGGMFVKQSDVKTFEVDDEIMHTGNAIRKLAEYEDAEEQRLLLKLPCKVGDTVYEISRVEPYRNPAIREMGVVDILLRDNDMYFTLQDLYDRDYDNSILSTEFGYTVFFTREQAEQALSEMKGV